MFCWQFLQFFFKSFSHLLFHGHDSKIQQVHRRKCQQIKQVYFRPPKYLKRTQWPYVPRPPLQLVHIVRHSIWKPPYGLSNNKVFKQLLSIHTYIILFNSSKYNSILEEFYSLLKINSKSPKVFENASIHYEDNLVFYKFYLC